MIIRGEACSACPYRRDVPSGVWSADDYRKLPPYDAETWAQPLETFRCHATPDALCHGWAVVHTSRGNAYDLLALRLADCGDVPDASVPLFASGTEAAAHGLRDVAAPSADALAAGARLWRKYDRLRQSGAASSGDD